MLAACVLAGLAFGQQLARCELACRACSRTQLRVLAVPCLVAVHTLASFQRQSSSLPSRNLLTAGWDQTPNTNPHHGSVTHLPHIADR